MYILIHSVDQVVSLSMVMIIEFITPPIYDRSVTSFDWNEGRLEVDHAVMNLPKLLKERYFHPLYIISSTQYME